MAEHTLELEGYSIVVLGSFNPTIFQPLWLSENNLIRKEEAAQATIQIIHRDATIFSTEWFSLQVTKSRFTIESKDPTKHFPLRDLAFGLFQILEHTPLTAFGLNRSQQYRISTVETWHTFGHHYAPKESWNSILDAPGLRVLTMEGRRKDSEGVIQVRVEPWNAIPTGLIISVNEHYDCPETQVSSTAKRNELFLRTIQRGWDNFLAYTTHASEHLLAEPFSQKKRKR